VKIAPDGEILVRGASVIEEYMGARANEQGRLEDGWLHTGDIGEVDAEGRPLLQGSQERDDCDR